MTTQEALTIVKEQMDNLTPYQCHYDKDGNVIGQITDNRAELLLGLSTLLVHLAEKEDVCPSL